jgi:hypothetical protein
MMFNLILIYLLLSPQQCVTAMTEGEVIGLSSSVANGDRTRKRRAGGDRCQRSSGVSNSNMWVGKRWRCACGQAGGIGSVRAHVL